MRARLTPHPHRGDTIAAGVVVLTTFAVLLEARFDGTWPAGVRFLVFAALLAFVGALAVLAPREGEAPRAYQSVLHAATFLLALLALASLADALGAGDGGGVSSGTLVWVGLLLCGLAGWFAQRRASAIMALLAALTGVVVVVAFVDWVFGIGSAQTVRWLLLLCAIVLTLAAVHQRDLRRRHAVALADVAALSVIAIGLTLVVEGTVQGVLGAATGGLAGGGFHGGPAGWELVLVVYGFALLAYGCVDRERVPAFLGLVCLALFVAVATPGGASLLWWPVLLLIGAGALLATGLRPREELPPEPAVTPPDHDGETAVTEIA